MLVTSHCQLANWWYSCPCGEKQYLGSGLALNHFFHVCESRRETKDPPLECFGTMRLTDVKKLCFLRISAKENCFLILEGDIFVNL